MQYSGWILIPHAQLIVQKVALKWMSKWKEWATFVMVKPLARILLLPMASNPSPLHNPFYDEEENEKCQIKQNLPNVADV